MPWSAPPGALGSPPERRRTSRERRVRALSRPPAPRRARPHRSPGRSTTSTRRARAALPRGRLRAIRLPGLRTASGIAEIEGNYPSKGIGERAAWFRDSEGNMLGIAQPVRAPAKEVDRVFRPVGRNVHRLARAELHPPPIKRRGKSGSVHRRSLRRGRYSRFRLWLLRKVALAAALAGEHPTDERVEAPVPARGGRPGVCRRRTAIWTVGLISRRRPLGTSMGQPERTRRTVCSGCVAGIV